MDRREGTQPFTREVGHLLKLKIVVLNSAGENERNPDISELLHVGLEVLRVTVVVSVVCHLVLTVGSVHGAEEISNLSQTWHHQLYD